MSSGAQKFIAAWIAIVAAFVTLAGVSHGSSPQVIAAMLMRALLYVGCGFGWTWLMMVLFDDRIGRGGNPSLNFIAVLGFIFAIVSGVAWIIAAL